jgi:hypothetical protein
MKSLAYDLAKSELEMLMDCAVCNHVTAKSAQKYQERVSSIVAEAHADAYEDEYADLAVLEATASTYLQQQVDRYAHVLTPVVDNNTQVYAAFASVPGAILEKNSIAVPSLHHVTLSRVDNARLKRIIEAAEDVPHALYIIKSMSEVTASSVSYDLTSDSLSFIRRAVNGLSQDRTAKALKKAFGSLL